MLLIPFNKLSCAGQTGHICHSQAGHDGLTGFHEAVVDQPLPQEEQLLMASEEIVSAPTLHITEAFQPGKLFLTLSVIQYLRGQEENGSVKKIYAWSFE